MDSGSRDGLPNCGPRGSAGPRRRCFVTRRVADKDALVRFVAGPGDVVVPDVAGVLPGRGLWLSADRNVVNTACAKKLFAKGLRANVSVAPDLADRVEGLLARRCLDLLGLARRAGAAVIGFERVRGMLDSGLAGVLVTAVDGGVEGRRKLSRTAPGVPLVTLFSAAELTAALGGAHVVYTAVRAGGMARRFVAETRRAAGFRPDAEAVEARRKSG